MLKWAQKMGSTPSKHGSKQFNGPNCKNLLQKIDSLIEILPEEFKQYGICLKAFDDVRKATFGMMLEDGYQIKVQTFESSFKAIGIPIFPKAHVVMHHLIEFCERHGPLGPFCEQSFESAHLQFSDIWKNYKREIGHHQYAEQLKKAVIDFNSMRI